MAELVEIIDPMDPRLDDFRDLTVADRRPDRPGGRGLVIAEGVVVVQRLLASPYPIRSLLGVRRRYHELAGDLADVAVPYYCASAEVMAQAVGFHLNRGVLATADRVQFADAGSLLARSHTVAVLEGIGDHENMGSIFRNAAALGVDAVLLAEGCADPLYRRSVRVSMGNVFKVPFAVLHGWVDDACSMLHAHGFTIAALSPAADAMPLFTAGLAGARVALLLGSEGPGLTDQSIAASDIRVQIPMADGVDSLNVATAGAIAFAAVARQR
ncbi:RNA methyltransferase [Nakamurella antarctica]|uniref:RNA methyltransferase n=1 Tax=Nakamurella antarctica TaxID=1902245 RepID=A0A3G8ZIT2_9ACTN|nr:RNA methyltransferase [Nakamurella antarctica]AZI57269.1 RNA methyltransferase [Nakamurella antarctica]